MDIIVKYLPTWFPGVQFHRFAKKVRDNAHDARHLPLEYVADTLKVGRLDNVIYFLADLCAKSGGDIDVSIASTYLENIEDMSKRGIDKEIASTVAGTVYFGGYSRSCCVLVAWLTLFLGMSETVCVAAASVPQIFLASL
jgi:hypothetical protein